MKNFIPPAKHNYAYHTEAMDKGDGRGHDDVGLGAFFGLELYKYEFAALLMHAEHLEAVCVGPIPSVCPGSNQQMILT